MMNDLKAATKCTGQGCDVIERMNYDTLEKSITTQIPPNTASRAGEVCAFDSATTTSFDGTNPSLDNFFANICEAPVGKEVKSISMMWSVCSSQAHSFLAKDRSVCLQNTSKLIDFTVL